MGILKLNLVGSLVIHRIRTLAGDFLETQIQTMQVVVCLVTILIINHLSQIILLVPLDLANMDFELKNSD